MSRSKQKYNQPGPDKGLSEEQLLGYLQGRLPADQQHLIEEILLEDPFLNDAVEGLAGIKDKEQISHITTQLNLRLRRQIKEKKAMRRERRRFRPDRHAWIYILIVLLLIILSWVLIKQITGG